MFWNTLLEEEIIQRLCLSFIQGCWEFFEEGGSGKNSLLRAKVLMVSNGFSDNKPIVQQNALKYVLNYLWEKCSKYGESKTSFFYPNQIMDLIWFSKWITSFSARYIKA